MDHALEAAGSDILVRWDNGAKQERQFTFCGEAERAIFLDHCEAVKVATGECLCRQGEQSDALFFVTRGACEVIRDSADGKALRLAKLLPGAMAGELAFYSGEVRAASIIAALDSSVYVMRKPALDHMVIGKIAQDLKRMNQLVTLLR